QDDEGEDGYDAGGRKVVVSVGEAAHPDLAAVRLYEQVIYQVRLTVHGYGAYFSIPEVARAVKVLLTGPAGDNAVGVVDLDIDLVAVEVQLVEFETAVIKLDVVEFVMDHIQQSALGVAGHHTAAGYEYGAQYQSHYEQHHEREVYCYTGFNRKKPHFSSR